jgi:integrase
MAINKNASGTFKVVWRDKTAEVEGKDKRRFKTFPTKKEAKEFEVALLKSKSEGTYQAPSKHTVSEMTALYLEAGKQRWESQTYDYERVHCEKYLNATLGDRKLVDLAVAFADIEKAGEQWMAEHELGGVTVNKIYATLDRVYKFAARKYGIAVNPMSKVERKRTSKALDEAVLDEIIDIGEDNQAEDGMLRAIGADEVYSAREMDKIIEASEQGFERALLMTEILIGARHGELNALRWTDQNGKPIVDLKKRRVLINRSLVERKGGWHLKAPKRTRKSSNASVRYIPLPDELVSVLRTWKLQCPKSEHGFVFCQADGKPMTRKMNNNILARVAERAKVRVLSMNNLRHSFASQQLIAGVPVLRVSRLMGHSDPGVTLKVYSAWCDREESDSHQILAARILGASKRAANDDE